MEVPFKLLFNYTLSVMNKELTFTVKSIALNRRMLHVNVGSLGIYAR